MLYRHTDMNITFLQQRQQYYHHQTLPACHFWPEERTMTDDYLSGYCISQLAAYRG
jgi:hypothetical protein